MFLDCSEAGRALAVPHNSLEMATGKAIDWYMKSAWVRKNTGMAGQ
jgi:hypothetical protein